MINARVAQQAVLREQSHALDIFRLNTEIDIQILRDPSDGPDQGTVCVGLQGCLDRVAFLEPRTGDDSLNPGIDLRQFGDPRDLVVNFVTSMNTILPISTESVAWL
jgi:hypothetical protein